MSGFRASGARPPGTRSQHGISLIIAMLMLAVIGLASAAIMRNATSADQVSTNNRLQTQASQYAQDALRFCEHQLTLAVSARTVPVFAVATTAAWIAREDWAPGGLRPAYTLGPDDLASAVQPRVAPQCIVDATAAPDVYVVTARGFSPDYRANSATGSTRSGSVVWLQATVLVGFPPGITAVVVLQRTWQQLLTPPF
jgi:type IV pilus assembly protein PilX